MRTRLVTTIIRRTTLPLAVLAAAVTNVLAQQTLTAIPFPATEATSITDCTTPTVLNLSGGQTVTFEGGQFIHYKDDHFDGTMYATNSSSGCRQFDVAPYPVPVVNVRVTFSRPITGFELVPYNFFGQNQDFALGLYDDVGPFAGMGQHFPSQEFLPDPFSWPLPGFNFLVSSLAMFANSSIDQPLVTNWAWGITSLKIPQGEPDFVRFDYPESSSGSDDGKILISAASWDTTRPSLFQLPTGGAPRVKIKGTLVSGATKQPKAGTVYLKLNDPPDTAQYRGADAEAVDNDGSVAVLSVPTTSGIATVQTDAQGKFEITMTPGSRVAGDNYQFAGSTNATFTCPANNCPRSGIFTLWKRIYVEEQHMFKQGSFLNDIADAGGTHIPIDNPVPFQNLASGATLELVHADTSGEGSYFDFVTFRSVAQQPSGRWMIEIDPASVFSRDYGAPSSDHPSVIESIRRDGIGIVDAGTFDANSSYMRSLFGSMSIDIAGARQTIVEVPYVSELDDLQRIYFSSRWLQDGTAVNAFSRHANPNVFHRIAGTRSPIVVTATGAGVELGVTSVSGGSNNSFIFSSRIEDLAAGRVATARGTVVGAEYNGSDPVVINGEVTVHETVHFWVHEPAGHDQHGHCLGLSYRNPQLNCLMHEPYTGAGLADGIVDLHYAQHGADSEYMTVRRAADPVPQQ